MSGFGPPRYPHGPTGPFQFNNPRFPPLNRPSQQFTSNFRPRHPGDSYQGRPRGLVPFAGRSKPGGRYPAPYRDDRQSFGNRGRGQGYHGNKSFKRSQGQGQGIEAYYKHSMVVDPWKELEESYRKESKQKEEDTS